MKGPALGSWDPPRADGGPRLSASFGGPGPVAKVDHVHVGGAHRADTKESNRAGHGRLRDVEASGNHDRSTRDVFQVEGTRERPQEEATGDKEHHIQDLEVVVVVIVFCYRIAGCRVCVV